MAENEHIVVWLAGVCLALRSDLDRPYGRLTGLVVDEGWRGQGIGRIMLETVEDWLKERGASLLLITSGLHRVEAHSFYRHLGSEESGLRFVKRV